MSSIADKIVRSFGDKDKKHQDFIQQYRTLLLKQKLSDDEHSQLMVAVAALGYSKSQVLEDEKAVREAERLKVIIAEQPQREKRYADASAKHQAQIPIRDAAVAKATADFMATSFEAKQAWADENLVAQSKRELRELVAKYSRVF